MLENVLSVIIEYVDSLDKNPARARILQSPLSAVGGAECRRVSRTWRSVVDAAIGRDLPPMPSESLATLLAPGKLQCVLLSCRYVAEHNATFASYNSLVSRAENCALHLRNAAMRSAASDGQGAGRSHSRVSGAKFSSCSSSSSSGRATTSTTANSAMICRRVALKRIVGQLLASPAFSWCSTLGPEASRLLEGCVGASCLLHARWFSD